MQSGCCSTVFLNFYQSTPSPGTTSIPKQQNLRLLEGAEASIMMPHNVHFYMRNWFDTLLYAPDLGMAALFLKVTMHLEKLR